MERSARLSWPILVEGESGVGKELIAHALHRRGPRAEGPFVAINAGGLPRDLIESELFGHERGAFTGATGVKRGVFEQAHGGTLFLDEIGELPLDLQTRLLRVLETWRIRRVGAEDSREVDVRLVCATHRDVRVEVERGRFRTDLYYRIARLVIDVPPLRERGGDISILANHFLRLVSAEVGARVLSRDAMTKLESYSWPGNVRELRNVVAAAAAATACGVIDGDDIDRVLGRLMGKGALSESDAAILQVVERHRGNLSAAARALGVPRSTLRDRLKGLKRAAPVAARRAARAG
jgi:DNA-binding NtrC family response regulator